MPLYFPKKKPSHKYDDDHEEHYRPPVDTFLHKKHIRRPDEENVDAWLMTYADMITLILCFFAILLSISVPKREQFKYMSQNVSETFSPAQNAIYVTPHYKNEPDEVTDVAVTHKPREEKEDAKKPDIKPGDRLSVIDMNSASFFANGAATLSPDGMKVLDGVIEKIQGAEFLNYSVTIEGHTDDVPINTAQFPSNWELSTARAAAVARYFIAQGVSARRIRASGYADTFPKVPNRDPLGKAIPENQAQNRRVVIKLEKIEKNN